MTPGRSVQKYEVLHKDAQNPESNSFVVLTADQIARQLPLFAELFFGDGTESLTYVHELESWRITPVEPR